MFEFTHEEIIAITLSVKVAFFAVLILLIPAISISWIMATKEFRGKKIINSLLHLPLVVPPVVTGFVLLILFGKNGYIGSFLYKYFNIVVAFNWKGAVLASAVLGFPLMIRSMQLSFENINPKLLKVARSLGASKIKVFFSIVLPLSFQGIITGMILAFARSLGEFGATITFVSNIEGSTRTLPLAIYSSLQMVGGETVAFRLVLISISISFIALIISDYITEKTFTTKINRCDSK